MHAPILKKLLEDAVEEFSADIKKMRRQAAVAHDIKRFRSLIFGMSPQIFDHVMCAVENTLDDEQEVTFEIVKPIMERVLHVAVNLAINMTLDGLHPAEQHIRNWHEKQATEDSARDEAEEPTAPPPTDAPAVPVSPDTILD